nr:hypothetical protein [Tanacetum cinerariifolium]
MFQVLVNHHTSNGHQFTMSNRHQELTSPEQTASVNAVRHFITVVSYKLMMFGLTKAAAVNLMPLGRKLMLSRLRALIDGKKVVVSEVIIRRDLHLDDADGVECLPNEEILADLARIGYEKPPPNLTFYKAFFSTQWKF